MKNKQIWAIISCALKLNWEGQPDFKVCSLENWSIGKERTDYFLQLVPLPWELSFHRPLLSTFRVYFWTFYVLFYLRNQLEEMAAKSLAGVGDSERRISSLVSESSERLGWWRWWAQGEIKAEGEEERERERRGGRRVIKGMKGKGREKGKGKKGMRWWWFLC